MGKILLIEGMLLLLIAGLASAAEHDFGETKQLIDSRLGCDKLADKQLEAIGEYYMEQMHPGEQHEWMDEMMGGEGSERLRQMHIQMAKVLYCGAPGGMTGSGGMMGMMSVMMNGAGGNREGWQTPQTTMMQGIMGSGGYFGYWNFVNILYVVLLIGLIILVYLWIIKLWKEQERQRGK